MKIKIDANNISDVISSPISVLQFSATWCGPCRALSPIIDELAGINEDITFGKVDFDDVPEICREYNVRSIPTLIFFKDGVQVNRVSGSLSKNALELIINGLK